MTGEQPRVADEFDGPDLDRNRWLPHYLPQWSSRAETAARYEVRDGALRLFIPPEQALWCPDDHQPPLRVSGVQSGCFAGPVGSPVGQQPFRDGLLVREAQPAFWGWTPGPSRIELRARATITPRSMVSLWLAGIEDEPDRSGEITVMEIFGRSVEPGRSAEVGMGIKALRDPNAVEDFDAPRLQIDVGEWHTYAVEWTPDRAEHHVDGELVRTTRNPPTYPLQLMLAVFDFPEWSTGDDADAVPEFWIDYVRELPV